MEPLECHLRCARCAFDRQVGTIEPHVFVELYAGEGDPEYFNEEEHTQVTNGGLWDKPGSHREGGPSSFGFPWFSYQQPASKRTVQQKA